MGLMDNIGKTGYDRFLESIAKKSAMESYGQSILDELIERGISPADVSKKFWSETYFQLPAEAQRKAQKYLKSITGMEPGSVLAVEKGGKSITARDWLDIADNKFLDLPSSADYLEGIERGFVSLMEAENRRVASTASKTFIPKGLLPVGVGAASLYSPQNAQALQYRNMAEQQSLQEPTFDPTNLIAPGGLMGNIGGEGIGAFIKYLSGQRMNTELGI
jgi:hypothetical protein